jgi:uncharacterized protein YegJ (DUF2314 family)
MTIPLAAPLRTIALLAALALPAVLALPVAPLRAQIVDVPTGDAVMDAAIRKARESLDTFWARLATPQPGDEGFAVKIAYPTRAKNSNEHIWANNVVRSGDMVAATINNDPRDIADLKRGQRVNVPISRITDWMYVRDGKFYGAQTLRAVLSRMPKEQADAYRAKLAPE